MARNSRERVSIAHSLRRAHSPNRLKQAEVRLLGQLDRQGVTHGQGPEREVEWPTSESSESLKARPMACAIALGTGAAHDEGVVKLPQIVRAEAEGFVGSQGNETENMEPGASHGEQPDRLIAAHSGGREDRKAAGLIPRASQQQQLPGGVHQSRALRAGRARAETQDLGIFEGSPGQRLVQERPRVKARAVGCRAT